MDDLTVLIFRSINLILLMLESLAAILLMDGIFTRKQNKLVFLIVFVIQLGLCALNDQVVSSVILKKLVFIALYFIVVQILYSGGILSKLLCVGIVNFAFYAVDWIIVFGMQIILSAPIKEIFQDPQIVSIVGMISKILLVIIMLNCRKYCKAKRNERMEISTNGLMLPIALTIICYVLMIGFSGMAIKSTKMNAIEIIIEVVSIGIMGIATLFVINATEKSEKETAHIQLLQQKQLLQLKSLNDLQEAYAAQRKSAHEFNRHLTMIAEMLKQNEVEMAQKYVSSVLECQTQRVLAVNTHNMMVDTILNQFYYAAQKQNVDVDFRVNDLSEFFMPADETVVLLSNLLDNALEACERLEKGRKIRVQMIRNEKTKETFLSIRNTSAPVKIENGRIRTSKIPAAEHGYGMKNIYEILKKYSAETVVCYEEGWFQFTTLIPENVVSLHKISVSEQFDRI